MPRWSSTVCARARARACAPIEVPAGETRQRANSPAGRSGTYQYWADDRDAASLAVPFREMAGAFVVDPLDGRGCRPDAHHHRVDQPHAGAAAEIVQRRRSRSSIFVKLQAARSSS